MTDEPRPSRLAKIRKAFADYYQLTLSDGSYILVNGSQIVSIATKKRDDGWEVTFRLADGTSHSVTTAWTTQFVRDVFGSHVMGETDVETGDETDVETDVSVKGEG